MLRSIFMALVLACCACSAALAGHPRYAAPVMYPPIYVYLPGMPRIQPPVMYTIPAFSYAQPIRIGGMRQYGGTRHYNHRHYRR